MCGNQVIDVNHKVVNKQAICIAVCVRRHASVPFHEQKAKRTIPLRSFPNHTYIFAFSTQESRLEEMQRKANEEEMEKKKKYLVSSRCGGVIGSWFAMAHAHTQHHRANMSTTTSGIGFIFQNLLPRRTFLLYKICRRRCVCVRAGFRALERRESSEGWDYKHTHRRHTYTWILSSCCSP